MIVKFCFVNVQYFVFTREVSLVYNAIDMRMQKGQLPATLAGVS